MLNCVNVKVARFLSVSQVIKPSPSQSQSLSVKFNINVDLRGQDAVHCQQIDPLWREGSSPLQNLTVLREALCTT